LLCLVVFLYENERKNISKYNNGIIDPEFTISKNKNITIQDILNLENNISSKQSNNRFGLEFSNQNNFNSMNLNPSYEGIFNSNFASVY
jgi:hypothetical protein